MHINCNEWEMHFFIDAVLQFINRGEDSLPLTQGLWNINET